MIFQWVRILATIAPILVVASLTSTYWGVRRRVQLQAGNLLIEVVRPRAKKVETAGVVLYTMLFASLVGLLVFDAFSANEDMTTSRILQEAVFTFSMYAWLGMYWAGFRPTYVEFRERGLVCGAHFWPWESIREWSWSDGGYSLLLKMPDRINTYGIARRDVEAIEAILEEHLGPARQRSRQPVIA
jgi:hypothetical protein